MGYTALLFCPDDKTARTVTQVLSELEFTVEACIEPFAAVKKLMGTHFDAVVVDCDNEQNATLLFKSARNSTSNQTSLAVAVVEGQAGVAKAFRIGANLVLTKPINIEQAKGTLRVARGLLRKSEPGKPGSTGTTTTAIPATPAAPTATQSTPAAPAAPKPPAPKTVVTPKPVAPAAPKAVAPPAASRTTQIPVPKPATTQAWPAAAATANTKPAAQDEDLLGISSQPPAPKPAPVVPEPPAAPKVIAASPKVEKPLPAAEAKPVFAATSQMHIGGGAASAPAPALEPQAAKVAEKPVETTVTVPEKPAEPTASASTAYVGAAPSFSFGASAEKESSGGNKKIFIGVAAAIALAVLGYVGFSVLKNHSTSAPASAPTPVTAPAAAVATPQPKPSAQPAPLPTPPAASSSPAEVPAATQPASNSDSGSDVAETHATPKPSKTASAASAPGKPAAPAKAVAPAEEEAEPAPMIVKGGKVPEAPKDIPAADAPSISGMATGAAPPPDLVSGSTKNVTPMLQTLNISQGVSQGLLYKKVAPTYPPNAIRMRVEGAVELLATISKSGDITKVKVLSGDQLLTKAASDAVKQWKYKPYLLNGEPVEIQTQVTVNFKLPH